MTRSLDESEQQTAGHTTEIPILVATVLLGTEHEQFERVRAAEAKQNSEKSPTQAMPRVSL